MPSAADLNPPSPGTSTPHVDWVRSVLESFTDEQAEQVLAERFGKPPVPMDERELVVRNMIAALDESRGNRSDAARLAGLNRSTFQGRLAKWPELTGWRERSPRSLL